MMDMVHLKIVLPLMEHATMGDGGGSIGDGSHFCCFVCSCGIGVLMNSLMAFQTLLPEEQHPPLKMTSMCMA